MFEKIIGKFIGSKIETPKFVEPKVKADKFVDTFIKVTRDTPLSENPVKLANMIKQNQDIENEFSNLFSTPKAKEVVAPIAKDDNSHLISFLKNTFEPSGKKIKEELIKHLRDVKISVNTIINIGSIMVTFQGREEYQYIVQLKAGKNVITTKLNVKESGERGGFDERLTLSGITIDKIGQMDIIKDFLAGYKRHLMRKGWG